MTMRSMGFWRFEKKRQVWDCYLGEQMREKTGGETKDWVREKIEKSDAGQH